MEDVAADAQGEADGGERERERGQPGRPLKWKRNPRWLMALHGRQLAALWGHLGAARQLCFNPRRGGWRMWTGNE